MNDWPHAPAHRAFNVGTYMVTAATYQKTLHFKTADRLQFLHDTLLELASHYGWKLQAWAVLSNHYHFLAKSPEKEVSNLPAFLSQLHIKRAKYVNSQDGTPNRKVWWQYWDTLITYEYSYLSRLNYVNQNPVKHGLVARAVDYPWCSASWFQKTSTPAFYKTVCNFKIDKINILDDF